MQYPQATNPRRGLQEHYISQLYIVQIRKHGPLDLEYENIGAGWARDACTLPPVPIGPALALMFPPIVTFPPSENALTASSLLRTITKSVMSAPIWSPHPRPPVAMQEGADQDPSGRRAMTIPDPALPENTKPALRTWNTARPENNKDYSTFTDGIIPQA